jgi:hypothetical protein
MLASYRIVVSANLFFQFKGGFWMVSLFEFFFDEIEYLRKKMHEKEAQVNRLCDPEILKLSVRLDEKLNNFQRILQLATPGGIDQIFLSHEQLILQYQNKNMSFEYVRLEKKSGILGFNVFLRDIVYQEV